jgi:hypothetical protein
MKYEFKDLNVGQYQKLLKLGDNPKAIDVVQILTGKNRSQLTLKEINEIEVGNLNPPESIELTDIIEHDGVYYGRINMHTLSFGEFIDLLDYAKDISGNLTEIVALMWRPIDSFTLKDRFKIKMAGLLIKKKKYKKGLNLLTGLNYKLEEYDTLKCDMRHKVIKSFPAATAHWAVSFFLNLSQILRQDSLKSLMIQAQQNQEMIMQSLRETILTKESPEKT